MRRFLKGYSGIIVILITAIVNFDPWQYYVPTTMEKSMTQAQVILNSKLGPLYLVASELGLQGVFWKKQKAPLLSKIVVRADNKNVIASLSKTLTEATQQLEEYFAGIRKTFTVPLDLQGTDFQIKVWKSLSQIPYGKTRSYQDIARKIKNPKAVRAVGTANAKNPLCIIIPCHRVIASSGKLSGYSGTGGVATKALLLRTESLFT